MDDVATLLEWIRARDAARGRLRGFFHLLVGHTLKHGDKMISAGMNWRDLSKMLKLFKFDRELVRELGLDPDALPPKDREKYWYLAIAAAEISGDRARAEALELAAELAKIGIAVDGLAAIAESTVKRGKKK